MKSVIRSTAFLVVILILVSAALSTSLGSFKTCPAALKYMVDNASKRVGAWGLRRPSSCIVPFNRLRGPGDVPIDSPTSTTGSAPPPPVEGVDFSGTNVQVSGVDEPDIVKTDGENVFTISGNNFFFTKVTNSGMGGRVVANLTLPTYPTDMLYDPKSDSIVIISQEYEDIHPVRSPFSSRLISPYYQSRPVIVLYRISVKKTRSVKITDKSYIRGRYISARSVQGVARIVFQYDASDNIAFVQPSGKLTEQEATKVNIKIVKNTPATTWFPTYNSTGKLCYGRFCRKYTVRNRLVSDCSLTYYPKGEFSGYSVLTVATFNLAGPFVIKGSSIIANGDTVYATADSLYAATTEYRYDLDEEDESIQARFKTSFHKFALGSRNARYIASGEVTGSVLNQFSMHEYKGTFFVATTEGSPWWGARDTSVSKVSAFRVNSNMLKKVGEVGGLGKGEQIYAVRYIADVAYVVTFREVDPLYIVDLSNVYNLKVTGELKIPGYSAYLHPIAPGRILGVGRDATDLGRTTGAKVSLFDVSDVTSPVELSSWTLEGSYTTAEWDHKAFLWWGPENVAVLPLSVYDSDTRTQFAGSIVLNVSDKDITERGRVSHRCCGRNWRRRIERNFVIGRTNLWSFSRNSLQVNDIKSLATKSSIPLFPQPTVLELEE